MPRKIIGRRIAAENADFFLAESTQITKEIVSEATEDMMSIEESKKLLGNPNISDEEVERIRDEYRALVGEIIFPHWFEEQKKIKASLQGN